MASSAGTLAKPSRLLAALATATTLGGCSTLGLINAVQPKAGLSITREVAFEGAGGSLRLDVYAPMRTGRAAPVVVFFYGGGWDSGRRQDYAFVGEALARRGYVAVIPDYRVYPQARWPAFLQDNALAVRWAKDHGGEYGGDPARLVLMGHSAGAYNAAMLALDGRWLGAVGLDPRVDVRAMVGLAGPYDFLPLRSERLKEIFGPPEQRPDTQPINHVGERAPPLWLAADTGDKVVEAANSARLAAAVRAKGGSVEERYYGGLNHALMVGVIAVPLRFLAPVLKDASAFIDAHTRAEARP
jgi:acetyl esterase/lipase